MKFQHKGKFVFFIGRTADDSAVGGHLAIIIKNDSQGDPCFLLVSCLGYKLHLPVCWFDVLSYSSSKASLFLVCLKGDRSLSNMEEEEEDEECGRIVCPCIGQPVNI